eukprot:jgi/Astpho2/3594/Aster-x1158
MQAVPGHTQYIRGAVLRPSTRTSKGTKEERAAEREEQFELQKELLKKRRDGSWQQKVKDRRALASKYIRDPAYKKQVDDERREQKKRDKLARGEEERSGFRFIVPIAPFGLPEYDEGERFDLRGGYVDNGWVDEDEVPLGEKLSSFFGFSKKKEVSKTAPRKGKK